MKSGRKERGHEEERSSAKDLPMELLEGRDSPYHILD